MVYGSFLLLKTTIFDSQYTIKRVLYDTGDVQRYDDPYMYKYIKQRILKENYYIVKRYKNRIRKDVVSKYPMISDVKIDYRSTNTVFVKLIFDPIDLVIRNQDQLWMVVSGVVLPVFSGNAIVQGVQIVDLPEYLSGLDSLS